MANLLRSSLFKAFVHQKRGEGRRLLAMKGNETPTYITTAALSDIYSPFLSFIESSSRAKPRRTSSRRILPGSSREPHSAAYIGILLLMAKHNLEESCRTLAGKMLRWREVKSLLRCLASSRNPVICSILLPSLNRDRQVQALAL